MCHLLWTKATCKMYKLIIKDRQNSAKTCRDTDFGHTCKPKGLRNVILSIHHTNGNDTCSARSPRWSRVRHPACALRTSGPRGFVVHPSTLQSHTASISFSNEFRTAIGSIRFHVYRGQSILKSLGTLMLKMSICPSSPWSAEGDLPFSRLRTAECRRHT